MCVYLHKIKCELVQISVFAIGQSKFVLALIFEHFHNSALTCFIEKAYRGNEIFVAHFKRRNYVIFGKVTLIVTHMKLLAAFYGTCIKLPDVFQ